MAYAHVIVGAILAKQGDTAQGKQELTTGLRLLERLGESDASNALVPYITSTAVPSLAHILIEERDYAGAHRVYVEARDRMERLLAKTQGPAGSKQFLAQLYSTTAWTALLARRAPEAVTAAQTSLEIDPTSLLARMNLAHAYLLTGQVEQARAIYVENKDVVLDDRRGFTQVVLKDFKDLRDAGLSSPDMDEIEAMLTAPTP